MNQLVLFSLTILALANADVSHLTGYNYQSPSGSYLPSATSGVGHVSAGSVGSASFVPRVVYEPSGSYLPGEHVGSGSGHGVSGISGLGGFSGFGGGSLGVSGHDGLSGHGVSGGVFGVGSGFGGLDGGVHGGHGHEETEVHFYGGDDHEQSRLRIHVAAAPSRNRVIFVKSPDAGSSVIPEIVAPSAASVDRTVVYVLSKKQQPVGQINIPASVHNVVKSKPQVYYLRYKDAQDAERAVAESLSGKGIGHVVRPADKDSFVKSLASGAHGGITGVLGSFGGSGVHGLGSGSYLVGVSDGLGSGVVGVDGLGVSGISGLGDGSRVSGSGSSSVLHVTGGTSGGRYGTPGASGPY